MDALKTKGAGVGRENAAASLAAVQMEGRVAGVAGAAGVVEVVEVMEESSVSTIEASTIESSASRGHQYRREDAAGQS